MNSVTLRVPASTSNLGSGFDTLGLAVNLYNKVTLTKSASTQEHPPIIKEAAQSFFRRAKKSPFQFRVSITDNIPMARGLGASGALRAAIVAGLNQLARAKLPTQTLLEIVTDLEGHPDNASPALLGGCTVSGRVGKDVRCLRFAVSPKLKIVTLIPNFKVETEQARRLIPQTFSKADTAHSLNRAALIAAAFAAKNYQALRGLFDDRLHQPHRLPLVPQLNSVMRAGEKAGAIGGFLSGSGSAIICLTLENPQAVAKAMNSHLPGSEVLVLQSDNRGLQVL
ncbi:MAG TPA: homoserine kinase [Verrucomicrobiae bacterium]|nr:homoserine kinase [Verrucomicrobiae bacterium]